MNIAIIGAGFTGLAAGFALIQNGHSVTIFEKDIAPGGLAIGYKEKEWEWTLEKHYHHWFTNDNSVLSLAERINYPVLIKRPKTSVYVNRHIYQLDSPSAVLRFPELSFGQRLRMSTVLGLLKFSPIWKPLERFNAATTLPSAMGKKPYEMIWEPLLINKFGAFADDVSLAWFWARIYKRTPSLAYPEQGFLAFASALTESFSTHGGTLHLKTEIESLLSEKAKVEVAIKKGKKTEKHIFDKAIVTVPSALFLNIAPQLPSSYQASLGKLKSLGAINLILRLGKPFFTDNTYWLSVCDKKSPIMAIVEHTHFMDKKYYNNEHILYLGNYLPRDHTFFTQTEEEILNAYDPFLKTINPTYKTTLIGMKAFKAPFAQPVIPVNYSRMIPGMQTPLPNVFLANIDQVYPWDRGTNYAVELGEKVAQLIRN
ncbi:MAG: FAD-dependent oxidoreductase [Candidatus Levybacteria bacterium]|nr:FAD-dependent oxidoreductase [Candidatus Levybacteria bacterium]